VHRLARLASHFMIYQTVKTNCFFFFYNDFLSLLFLSLLVDWAAGYRAKCGWCLYLSLSILLNLFTSNREAAAERGTKKSRERKKKREKKKESIILQIFNDDIRCMEETWYINTTVDISKTLSAWAVIGGG